MRRKRLKGMACVFACLYLYFSTATANILGLNLTLASFTKICYSCCPIILTCWPPYLTYKILKHKEQKFIIWRLKGVKVLLCSMVNVIQKNTVFFEGYQASDNSSVKRKASAQHCCTDTKRSKQKYSEGNLSQYHFPHHKFHVDLPGIDPGPRRWKAATKRPINPHYTAHTGSVCTSQRTLPPLGWVHTCNVTAYRNTVSWQCWRDSCPCNVSKVGNAVTLRACSVCCRYLAVASKGWYG